MARVTGCGSLQLPVLNVNVFVRKVILESEVVSTLTVTSFSGCKERLTLKVQSPDSSEISPVQVPAVNVSAVNVTPLTSLFSTEILPKDLAS